MEYEKSCGAVIYRNNGQELEYLLIFNKKIGKDGHWGFPKGHREGTENEYETAAREIMEEIGLSVVFCGSTRIVSTYSPKENVKKDAVYFLATVKTDADIKLQNSEVSECEWCNSAKARSLLTYDREILDKIEKSI